MLEVQKFLMIRESDYTTPEQTLQRLKDKHGIKFNIWNDKLCVLNYSQIESKKTCAIAQECRSLVLEVGTWEVVSRSFDRFFNYGESPCPEIDIQYMTAYEKVDGSLIGLFNYQGKWLYRTRSVIMPEGPINDWKVTWKDHIEYALQGSVVATMNKDFTHIMELTSPENRVVTKYASNTPLMTLLAVRNNASGMYLGKVGLSATAIAHDLRLPREYKFDTISDCLQCSKELRDLQEGYVLYSQQGYPVCKVKNPAYVAAHHLRGEGLNPKRIKDLIIMGETDEYLALFPEDVKMFKPYTDAYVNLITDILGWFGTVNDLSLTQKDFAIKIKVLPFKSVLFTMRKGKTFTEAWEECTTNTKYKLIDAMLEKGNE